MLLILLIYGFFVQWIKFSHQALSLFSSRLKIQYLDRYEQQNPRRLKTWFVASSLGESKIVRNIWDLDKGIDESNSLTVLQTPWALESMLKTYPRGFFRLNPFDCQKIWKAWMLESKPACVYLVEGELWPNLLLECRSNGVEVRWVSALISSKARVRWYFLKSQLYKLLDGVYVSCADEDTFEFLEEIDVHCRLGCSLKPLQMKSGSVEKVQTNPHFKIACLSWHFKEMLNRGEELVAFQKAIVIQLRHLNELDKFKNWFEKRGMEYSIWPEVLAETPCIVCQIGTTLDVVDSSDGVLIGGSFAKEIGVHNALEALSLGKKVGVGPWIEDSKYKEWEELFKKGLLIKIASSFEEADLLGINSKSVIDQFEIWLESQKKRQQQEWDICAYEKEGWK